MPSGVQSPLNIPTGKSALGCLSAAPQSLSTARRQTHSRLPVAAAAVHPWPWRNMSTDSSSPSLRQGVKLSSPLVPSQSFAQPAKQSDPESVWHAVDLQEDSSSSIPSAVEATEAAAEAFRVESPQQLQVPDTNTCRHVMCSLLCCQVHTHNTVTAVTAS